MADPLSPALLDAVAALAVAAGAAILPFYEGACAVETKEDGSPVTQADLAAEAVILPGLARLAQGAPTVSEEQAAQAPATGRRFFLVDPLDGTREFLARNGEFTVNIALVEDGAPVLGVVHAPALGLTWLGARGLGAFAREAKGDGRRLSTRPAPAQVTAIASRSHGGAQTGEWLRRLDVARFVAAGSSLKFCRVAAGEADVYPRLGRTMEWDTAAGDAILRAAGGIVVGLDGRPLAYGKRGRADEADFANPAFVAFGDPALARRACGGEAG